MPEFSFLSMEVTIPPPPCLARCLVSGLRERRPGEFSTQRQAGVEQGTRPPGCSSWWWWCVCGGRGLSNCYMSVPWEGGVAALCWELCGAVTSVSVWWS